MGVVGISLASHRFAPLSLSHLHVISALYFALVSAMETEIGSNGSYTTIISFSAHQ
jgi:hypothetical protein